MCVCCVYIYELNGCRVDWVVVIGIHTGGKEEVEEDEVGTTTHTHTRDGAAAGRWPVSGEHGFGHLTCYYIIYIFHIHK